MPKKPHSVKTQDKPQTKVRMAERRARALQLFSQGLSKRKTAAILRKEGYVGASDANVGFDLQALSREAPEKVARARQEAEYELNALKKFVAEADDMSSSETVSSLLAIHDRIARLLGLDAPTKSLSAKVNVDDPAKLVGYRKFVEETRLLSEEQLQAVYTYIRTLKPETINAPTRFRRDS